MKAPKVSEVRAKQGAGDHALARQIMSYVFADNAGVSDDIRAKYGFDGDLLRIYAENKGRAVHKWHHYIPLYDRYFAPFRNRPLRFLEIGVSEGGSLQMWRSYFGAEATLFGVDIDAKCAALDGEAGSVRIGSQDDPGFLAGVVEEMGGVDIVLDDGSHRMDHIGASLKILFPRLSAGGIYFIEDLHTAYWPEYGGGYEESASVFNVVRELVDDMHVWYHDQGLRWPGMGGAVSGIHVHDSIAVLEKGPVHRPSHSKVV